ncbi:hypothetical protein HON71_04980 [Candidatus Woesearchaeota archaeon]|jgi:hypothetical protein|nr:hypothetical protein [Candidatus Woesearchaeota archaeon]MBT5342388.1 hypothetical protein [Candidatus Woesearchaeota archaeon]
MINISQLVRKSKQHPLTDRLLDFVEPELYLAENVADYKENRSILVPPWFKRNPFSTANDYAFISFYNVGIDATSENGEMNEDLVNIHDESGSATICWTGPGHVYPCKDSYFQMLDSGELKPQDWVYRLDVRLIYEFEVSFVIGFKKNKFSTPKTEKSSLVDKISSLFPEPEPSY